MKPIVLIDGKYLAYKMHFSHLSLRTTDGKPSGLLYGFLTELLRINKRLPDARILICWDGEGKTWRHKTFPEYKANRTFNPEMKRMIPQIKELLPFLEMLGMWVLRLDDVEADDMIGLAAKMFSALKCEVRIHSKDRDMFQLADDYVWIWPDLKLAPLRRSDIEKWLGAPFEALTEIRAMAGDAGDNLHGLRGVGYITAVKLWKQGLRISDVSNSVLYAKYKKDWKRVREEYKLAQIVTDPLSEVWSERTSKSLTNLLKRLKERPGRDVDMAEDNRRLVYRFLGRYELNDLLTVRQKLFLLP